jgi:hypothetical protein
MVSAARKRLCESVGYRLEQSIEDGQEVERIYRPDGSLAITAKRPQS